MIRSTAIAVLVSSWSLCAQAQSASLPERSVDPAITQSALAAFNRHDYATALAQFERAAVSAPSLTADLYMARSRVALGQLVEAADDYRALLASAVPGQKIPAVASARDELAQLRPRIPTNDLELGDAEQRSRNLRVVMDGGLVAFGTPVTVNPGVHEVVAKATQMVNRRGNHFEINEGVKLKTVGMTWLSPSGHAARK